MMIQTTSAHRRSISVPKVESRPRKLWSKEEDEILRQQAGTLLHQEGITNAWSLISTSLPGRTNKDCRKRWTKVCKKVNKGAWNEAEDERLLSAVRKFGQCWIQVAEVVETRHADQCAKRWQQSLDPSLIHTKWKPEDHQRLLQAVEFYGRRWKTISENCFPGRSTTDLKNRFSLLTRERASSRNYKVSKYETAVSDEMDATINWELGGNSPCASEGTESNTYDSHSLDYLMNTPPTDDLTMSPTAFDLSSSLDSTHDRFFNMNDHHGGGSISSSSGSSDLDQAFYNIHLANSNGRGTSGSSATSEAEMGDTFSWGSSPELLADETFAHFIASGKNAPTVLDNASNTALTDATSALKTTLVLEDVDSVTLSQVIAILTERNTKMKMETRAGMYN